MASVKRLMGNLLLTNFWIGLEFPVYFLNKQSNLQCMINVQNDMIYFSNETHSKLYELSSKTLDNECILCNVIKGFLCLIDL